MRMETFAGRLMVGCMAVLVGPSAMAAAPAARDPWALVPPFPSGCYAEDDFSAKIDEASGAVNAEIDRREAINKVVSDRFKQIEPAELATKMQEYMMSNPEAAMKLMQANADLSQTASDATVKTQENLEKLFPELQQLEKQYKTAVATARAPFDSKFKTLDKRAQKDLVARGESWVYAPWAVKEYNALTDQWNAEYQKVCRSWWPAGGKFPAWLSSYKESLVRDLIPASEEGDRVAAGFLVIMAGAPEASWQSTAGWILIRDYLRQTNTVFAGRSPRPDPHME